MSKIQGISDLRALFSNLFGTRDLFHGRQFFPHNQCRGDDLGMIQEDYIYCVLHFNYYISCTVDYQTLDPRGWGPLP